MIQTQNSLIIILIHYTLTALESHEFLLAVGIPPPSTAVVDVLPVEAVALFAGTHIIGKSLNFSSLVVSGISFST
jgi:hypothetical protein